MKIFDLKIWLSPERLFIPLWQSRFNWSNLSCFHTFSPQIFLKHHFLQYILIIKCKIKCRVPREMAKTKIRFFLTSRYHSHLLNFSTSNFHKMSYYRLCFDNLMINLGVTYDNFLPQNLAKSREPREVVVTPIQSKFNWENLSCFHTFSPQIFLKHLFVQYIWII